MSSPLATSYFSVSWQVLGSTEQVATLWRAWRVPAYAQHHPSVIQRMLNQGCDEIPLLELPMPLYCCRDDTFVLHVRRASSRLCLRRIRVAKILLHPAAGGHASCEKLVASCPIAPACHQHASSILSCRERTKATVATVG